MVERVSFDNEKLINELQIIFNDVYKQKNELKSEIINNPYTQIYIYKDVEEIKGIIHINVIYNRFEINNIFVLEKYRSFGIASKLMEEIIDLGRKSDIINITLEVKEDNIPAINLYKKYGFLERAKRKGYYNGIDGILMEKVMGSINEKKWYYEGYLYIGNRE